MEKIKFVIYSKPEYFFDWLCKRTDNPVDIQVNSETVYEYLSFHHLWYNPENLNWTLTKDIKEGEHYKRRNFAVINISVIPLNESRIQVIIENDLTCSFEEEYFKGLMNDIYSIWPEAIPPETKPISKPAPTPQTNKGGHPPEEIYDESFVWMQENNVTNKGQAYRVFYCPKCHEKKELPVSEKGFCEAMKRREKKLQTT